MRYDVAIIGAGVAGLSAARALCPTLDVVVLEEEKLPGGLAWQLGCKATDECLYCGVCHGINLKRDLSETSDFCFDYHPGVTILAVRKFGEEFILTREGGEEVETSSILVATGVRPFDARLTSNLGYGTLPGVFTGYDIEKSLNTEGIQRFSTSHRIAFIQCVGSRNFLKKRGYCSQVCCRYALRIAEDITYRFPDMKIDLYYMDLQILGGKKEKLLSIAREKVRLVRHLPYRVEPGPEGKGLTLLFEDEQGVNRADYDAVVLSVGMVPSPGTRRVAELFRLSTDESGFIKDYSEGQTSQSGVFVCGTASGPRDIETAILHAKKVATRIMMKTQCQRPRCGKEA